MMHRVYYLTIALLLLGTAAPAQIVSVNPGITLGHTFGGEGGFTFGLEVSVTHWDEKSLVYGGVASWTITPASGRQKLHVGPEFALIPGYLPLSFGIDLGPTLVFRRGHETQFRFGVTLFAGMFAYPYYGFLLGQGNDPTELGVALKYPVIASGSINL